MKKKDELKTLNSLTRAKKSKHLTKIEYEVKGKTRTKNVPHSIPMTNSLASIEVFNALYGENRWSSHPRNQQEDILASKGEVATEFGLVKLISNFD